MFVRSASVSALRSVRSPEYFSLIILCAGDPSYLAHGLPWSGNIMAILGISLSQIGIDAVTGRGEILRSVYWTCRMG